MNGHLVFSSLHALAAVVALVAAVLAVQSGRGVRVHRDAMVATTGLLIPSMWFGWDGFGAGARPIFLGLLGLACFMTWRAGRLSGRTAREGTPTPEPDVVGVIGFNVVGLLIAGTIVPVIRLGGGPIGIVLAVVTMLTIGHLFVENRRARARRLVSA